MIKIYAQAILVMGVLFVASTANSTPFYSATVEGSPLTFFRVGASTYTGPSTNTTDFWSPCQGFNCSSTGGITLDRSYSAGMVLNEPGSVWAHQANLSYFPYVQTTVSSFPSSQVNSTAKAVFSMSTDAQMLSSIPQGNAVGYRLTEMFQDYAIPNRTGASSFSVSTLFDQAAVPKGYIANVETQVGVNIFVLWYTASGQPTFLQQSVFSDSINGTGNIGVSLPNDLNTYSSLSDAPYATYNVYVSHEIAFTVAPVPEPETYSMVLTGVGLMGFMVRRKKSA